MKKIWHTLKLFLVGLSLGMKKTEDDLLHQSGLDTTVGSSVNQQVKDKSLAKALLRGEVTQEVIDLRYRTYAVARESTHYKYFSPMLAKKKQDINDSNFVHFENSDNREVVTIQENKALIRNVNEFLETTENSKQFLMDIPPQYNILIEYSSIPKYKIDQFLKKIIVKKSDLEHQAILDLYVSKYPNQEIFISKSFVHEIEKVMKTQHYKIDMIENINLIEFETYKAYHLDDMIHFSFDNLILFDVIEYDGNYILRCLSDIVDGGTDLTEEFYSEHMAKKYENKEKKETTINFDPNANIREYTCANCGKKVIYDARNVDRLMATYSDNNNLDVTNNENSVTLNLENDNSVTEYLDFEMSEHVFGKMLCKECIQEEQLKLYKKNNEN